jgi:VWFA-related protein
LVALTWLTTFSFYIQPGSFPLAEYNSSSRIPNGGICPHLTPYDAYVIANRLDQTVLEIKAAEMSQCDPGRPANTRNPTANPGAGYTGTVQTQAEAMWAQIQNISRASLSTINDIVEFLGGMPGRRMILLASSGFLAQTLEQEQEEVTRHALRRQVVINSLDAKGVYPQDAIESTLGTSVQSFIYQNSVGTRQKDMSNEIMANLALSTGGLFFHNNNDLNLGFREVGLMPEVSYLLGFAPDDPPNGRYHKLKVQLRSKNQYSLQARPGYWAILNPEQKLLDADRPIDRKVMSADMLEELPARVTDIRATKENGDPALDVVLHIDVGRLHLEQSGNNRTQKLTWIAALFDAGGSFIVGKENGIELALKELTFNRMSVNGLNITLTLKAPPGPYKLRSVVQDSLDVKVAASSQTVEIR